MSRVIKTKYSRKMEERQLIKLEGWFKSRHISCLKIVAGNLNKLRTWIPVKEQLACFILKNLFMPN
ncbi:hypothetical protein [Pedobacter sp. P26]|uniref:hypothetical protein n=1 Tax=Pedobacter sp. P26 TaxID=3423956 RepID=UPI003D667440